MKKFLYDLLKTPSLSGDEVRAQKIVQEYMISKVDEVITDHVGNVISVINPNANFKILLDAHIDEIGLVVTNIKDDGRLRVSNIGAIRPSLYLGCQVQVITKDNILNGVIAQYRQVQNDKIEASELELDIGATSKEEASKLVPIGSYVISNSIYLELQNNHLASRALDDKIGVYAILKALLLAKELKATNGIYASSTVGEETTANGATIIANTIKPNMAIVVDVTTDTSSLPSLNNCDEIHMGLGPTISMGTIMNKTLVNKAIEVAKKYNIPYQLSTTSARTYTNTDKIHFANQGIPSLLLNIPLRYMHSSAEIVNMEDVENLAKLIAYICLEVNEDTNFKPL